MLISIITVISLNKMFSFDSFSNKIVVKNTMMCE